MRKPALFNARGCAARTWRKRRGGGSKFSKREEATPNPPHPPTTHPPPRGRDWGSVSGGATFHALRRTEISNARARRHVKPHRRAATLRRRTPPEEGAWGEGGREGGGAPMRVPAMGCASSKKQQSVGPGDEEEEEGVETNGASAERAQHNGDAHKKGEKPSKTDVEGPKKKAAGADGIGALNTMQNHLAARPDANDRFAGIAGDVAAGLGVGRQIVRDGLQVSGETRANLHLSESQIEFFRMLDEKIERGRDYCSDDEDVT
uniref:Uncharacterized protein C1orf21 homolog isoform X2 n=2 Tax=Petromyzon marinus TaxID=7757 RepID=A0AAJ7XF55_PETMA|nr:uncharacterized protein C1orf21 homolog isoform X2 [Petromyzon marinus]